MNRGGVKSVVEPVSAQYSTLFNRIFSAASPAILRFECLYHWRRPSFWLIAGLFFTFGLVDVVSNGTQGHAFFFINSPTQIFQTTIWYTIFGVLAASAFVAETFVRDSNYCMEALILSTPVRKWDYLGTRFLAAFGMTLLAFSAYLPGMLLGTQFPGLNPFAIGPLRWQAYSLSYFAVVIPNLFLVSALAFGVASRSRSLVMTYAGSIVLIMFYLATLMLVGAEVIDYDQYSIWAMLDPFGFYAFEEKLMSWSVHQHNTLMPTLTGTLLWNRLLWLAVGAGIWWYSYHRYQMLAGNALGSRREEGGNRWQNQMFHLSHLLPRSSRRSPAMPSVASRLDQIRAADRAATSPSLSVFLQQWIYRSRFETLSILTGRAFLLLTAFGLISLVITAIGSRSHNYSYPSTDLLIHSAQIYLEYILFAIIVIYAAELFWRDRTLRIQSVLDATSIPNGVLLLSKLTALFAIITVNLLLAILVLVIYQALSGYTDFEFPLYFQMLFVEHGPYFYLTAILALCTQVLIRQKYAAMGLTVLLSLSKIPLDALGWYHNLYRWASTNDIDYSPMNGYGHLLTGHLWYSLYWGLAGAVLVAIAYIFWPRGTALPGFRAWRQQIQLQWQQAGQGVKRSLATLIVLFAGVGSWIFYNTTQLNAYQPPGKELTAAEIERRFKQYENLPMPVVTATQLRVELYPEQGYFVAEGQYQLKNTTQSPITEIHLLTFVHLKLEQVSYPGATLRQSEPDWGYYIYDLSQPLLPGESQTLKFTTRTEPRQGFQNHVDSDDVYMIYPNEVVDNGSNLYSPFILPFVGYTKMVEHKKAWLRHQLGLPPIADRLRRHDDPQGLRQPMMLTHLDWGTVDLTVGTSASQTAIAAGDLVNRWQDKGRNYFRYQSKERDRGKFTIYSANYATYRNENYRVPIEIYYHPQHNENVELIAAELGQALEFYERHFGSYPFDQIRVVECVYYDGMTFSEGGVLGIPEVLVWKSQTVGAGKDHVIGWITYLLAQAWTEDAMIAADVAGSMTLREALSDYMSNLYQRDRRTPEEQARYKKQAMRNFFRQLGKIDFQEPPLSEVYNELPIARQKGGMILESIEGLIGQEPMLQAIRDFLNEYRYQPAPYATVLDLRDALLTHAKTSDRPLIHELFSEVITFQVGLADAEFEPMPNGRYRVKLTLEAQKLYTPTLDEQQVAPLNWPVTIALSDRSRNLIYQGKHQLNTTPTEVELIVNQRPTWAEVDPNYLLPSAFLQDNLKRLRPAAQTGDRVSTPDAMGR